MKYTRKDENGEYFLDEKGFRDLELCQHITCFNKTETNTRYLEFLCCACNKIVKSLGDVTSHWQSSRHNKEAKPITDRLKSQRSVPPLVNTEEEALSRYLETLLNNKTLGDKDLAIRNGIAKQVENALINAGLKGHICRVYGSSLTSIGFKDAGVDIDIQFDEKKLQASDPTITSVPCFYLRVSNILKKCGHFCDVIEKYHEKTPALSFTHVETGLKCYVYPAYRYSGFHSSLLIQKYTKVDNRAKFLCLLFKYWAMLCNIDDPFTGGMSPYCFTLMVIHYLQQTTPPVLPIIKIDVKFDSRSRIDKLHEEKFTIGEEMIDSWKSCNTDSIGKLWLGLFRYYLIKFHMKAMVINIRQIAPIARLHKPYGNKRIAIEDPFISDDNVANSIFAATALSYFCKCMDVTFKYFSNYGEIIESNDGEDNHAEKNDTPRKTTRKQTTEVDKQTQDSDTDVIVETDDVDESPKAGGDRTEDNRTTQKLQDTISLDRSSVLASTNSPEDNDHSAKENGSISSKDNDKHVTVAKATNVDSECDKKVLNLSHKMDNLDFIEVSDQTNGVDATSPKRKSEKIASKRSLKRAVNKFEFFKKHLTPNNKMPVICMECSEEGHSYQKCHYITFEIKELKSPQKDFVKLLDKVCLTLMKVCELPAKDFEYRLKILKEMEMYLKENFRDDCRLALFGSSVNQFGFQGSDMDICLRFCADEIPPGVNNADNIVRVSKVLDKHPLFHKVMYIRGAKVPIVKFEVGGGVNLEGDISLYNCLALANSSMLATYARIDKRVRVMGYCMKVFAKRCEIGDASRGSLSSYAYILLVLYYLQHTEPPVIPVLQELYNKKKGRPECIVEGWNTWFYQDLENLPSVWSGYGKNKQSVGELWLGFFRFYLEKFDFRRNVVAIKQFSKVSKFEKGWVKAQMTIEDPFNLVHNLGAGLRRNMFQYIMKCFMHARSRYGTSSQKLPKTDNIVELQAYFFDPVFLTGDQLVPKDRLCRRCGRIGHQANNCAEKFVDQRERQRRRRNSEKTSEEGEQNKSISEYEKDRDESFTDDINADEYVKCFICRKVGHRKINCPNKMRRDERKKMKVSQDEHKAPEPNNQSLHGTPVKDKQDRRQKSASNSTPHGESSRTQNKISNHGTVIERPDTSTLIDLMVNLINDPIEEDFPTLTNALLSSPKQRSNSLTKSGSTPKKSQNSRNVHQKQDNTNGGKENDTKHVSKAGKLKTPPGFSTTSHQSNLNDSETVSGVATPSHVAFSKMDDSLHQWDSQLSAAMGRQSNIPPSPSNNMIPAVSSQQNIQPNLLTQQIQISPGQYDSYWSSPSSANPQPNIGFPNSQMFPAYEPLNTDQINNMFNPSPEKVSFLQTSNAMFNAQASSLFYSQNYLPPLNRHMTNLTSVVPTERASQVAIQHAAGEPHKHDVFRPKPREGNNESSHATPNPPFSLDNFFQDVIANTPVVNDNMPVIHD